MSRGHMSDHCFRSRCSAREKLLSPICSLSSSVVELSRPRLSLSLEIDVFIQFIDGRSGPHQQRTGPSLAHSLGRCRISIIHLTAPTLARIAHQLNWTALRDLRSFKRVNYTLRLVYNTFRVGQKSKLLYCDRYFKGWTIALAFNIL